jgi:hypothetical protein
MKKIMKFALGCGGVIACFLILAIAGIITLFMWLAPYGPEYLQEWSVQGNKIVEMIESSKESNGIYPDQLPMQPDKSMIPGCHQVTYVKQADEKGEEYYRLYLYIHKRECVIYDSRGKFNNTTWGTQQQHDGWLWTID